VNKNGKGETVKPASTGERTSSGTGHRDFLCGRKSRPTAHQRTDYLPWEKPRGKTGRGGRRGNGIAQPEAFAMPDRGSL